jgi:hypothetical protein
MRDDIPILTTELPDENPLASSPVDVRFSHGTESPAIFREIAADLAAVRGGGPEVIDGGGHALYLQPDVAAAYIRSRSRSMRG